MLTANTNDTITATDIAYSKLSLRVPDDKVSSQSGHIVSNPHLQPSVLGGIGGHYI